MKYIRNPRLKPRIKKIIKNCAWCGDEFKGCYQKKYCNPECAQEGAAEAKRKRQGWKVYRRICKYVPCNKPFTTRVKRKVYCTNICGYLALKDQGRIRRENRNRLSGINYTLAKIKWCVFNRDNFTCQYCGKNPTQDGVRLELDHIQPQAKGGSNIMSNYVTAYNVCNGLKNAIPLAHEKEFKLRITKHYLKLDNKRDLQTAFKFLIDAQKGGKSRG